MGTYCSRCGTTNADGVNYCANCGAPLQGAATPSGYAPPPQPYAPYPVAKVPGADKKITAGVLGLMFGGLGVHKFVLGYTAAGVIQLLAGVFTCGIFAIVGHIEGIIYLTKSDQEFVDTYVIGKREWF